jgi:hypothetical protein
LAQGTLKPRLLKLFANPHKFIASIVNASVVYGFDGVVSPNNNDLPPQMFISGTYPTVTVVVAALLAEFGL